MCQWERCLRCRPAGPREKWGSYRAVHLVRGHSRSQGMARAVLVAIAEHMGSPDLTAEPGRSRLADGLGVSVKTVSRAIKELVDLGELKQERRGQHNSPRYTLMLSRDNVVSPERTRGDTFGKPGETWRAVSRDSLGSGTSSEPEKNKARSAPLADAAVTFAERGTATSGELSCSIDCVNGFLPGPVRIGPLGDEQTSMIPCPSCRPSRL